jgi:prephenate dehydrogenase
MDDPDFRRLQDCRVAIVGVGLMGGSLGLDLRGLCAERVGVGRSAATLALAQVQGMIDRTADFDAAVESCDLIILATPPRTILAQLQALGQRPAQRPAAGSPPKVIMDLGSTKTDIVAAMGALPAGFDPVGGHPMCGKEVSGAAAAEPGLYRGQTFILTPLARTTAGALGLAQELVRAVGARPLVLAAARQDAMVAQISHLPYVAAVALVKAAQAAGDEQVWEVAASGFRDTSRLAASDLTMMLDILLTNREAVARALAGYRAELEALARLIDQGDAAALRAALEPAQAKRSELFGPTALTPTSLPKGEGR